MPFCVCCMTISLMLFKLLGLVHMGYILRTGVTVWESWELLTTAQSQTWQSFDYASLCEHKNDCRAPCLFSPSFLIWVFCGTG